MGLDRAVVAGLAGQGFERAGEGRITAGQLQGLITQVGGPGLQQGAIH